MSTVTKDWVRHMIAESGGGGGSLPIDQQKLIDAWSENDMLYIGDDPSNPKELDWKIVKQGVYLFSYQWVNGEWKEYQQIGGSTKVDTLILEGLHTAIYETENNEKFNIWRKGSTVNSNVYGSTQRRVFILANGRDMCMVAYAGDSFEFNPSPDGTQEINLETMTWEFDYSYEWDVEVTNTTHKLYKPTKARLSIMDITDGENAERLIYESMNEKEFKLNGGMLISNDQGETVGTIDMKMNDRIFLIAGRRYRMVAQCKPNDCGFIGINNFPWVLMRGSKSEASPIAVHGWVENRLKSDITLDNGMWLLTTIGNDSNRKQVANIGGMYDEVMWISDTSVKTILKSLDTPRMQTGNNGAMSKIASENFVKTESIPRVFHKDELTDGRNGFIIQTIPPTYTMYEPTEFKTYNSLGFMKRLVLKFMSNLKSRKQLIYRDDTNECFIQINRNGGALLNIGCYKLDGGFESITIDTSNISNPPEGHYYPSIPYISSEDREEESFRVWTYDYSTIDNVSYITITDPNGGAWTVHVQNSNHCAKGGVYNFGKQSNGECVKRLWDIMFECNDLPENPTHSDSVDETVTGIQTARLVTKMMNSAIDILDPIAIHKYADLTKDFHTFFEPKTSGIYRCFQMEQNLPKGYIVSDNDFYCFVYTTSQNYKCIEALDIRSGRRFIKTMYNGKWKDWVETGGTGSVPLIPKSVYLTHTAVKGTLKSLPMSDLTITKDDILMVSCGTRGMAVKVLDASELEYYSASYFIDVEADALVYHIDSEGTSRCSIEIFKYSPIEVASPEPWHPYLRIDDVLENISEATKAKDQFYVSLSPTSWELVRNPEVSMTLPRAEERTPLIFDGKERYYFEFPFDCAGQFNSGDTVTYKLIWRDQFDNQYEGDERINKPILV